MLTYGAFSASRVLSRRRHPVPLRSIAALPAERGRGSPGGGVVPVGMAAPAPGRPSTGTCSLFIFHRSSSFFHCSSFIVRLPSFTIHLLAYCLSPLTLRLGPFASEPSPFAFRLSFSALVPGPWRVLWARSVFFDPSRIPPDSHPPPKAVRLAGAADISDFSGFRAFPRR
jgi:hypothetical protein